MGTFIDLTGQVYGKFLVIERATEYGILPVKWLCECECGKEKVVAASHLRMGKTISCGCFKANALKERSVTHGMSSVGKATPEYRAWLSIKERCLNPKSKSYYQYGGRGIKVFDEWVNNFIPFYKYVGKRPTSKHSIDRFPNNDGDYEPNNVRWATPIEQASNKRITRFLTHNNVTNHVSGWARILNVHRSSILVHLKNGKTISDIISFYEHKRNTTYLL